MQTTRVWDLPTRLFHWLLALAVVGLVVTGQAGGSWMDWHFRLGYSVLALLLFRLVWGFVGGHWSRFANFFYTPTMIWRYLRGQGTPEQQVGHNPLGFLSILGLLGFALLQVATGLFSDDEIASAGPLSKFASGAWVSRASDYHTEVGKFVLLALIGVHIAAVLFYRIGKGQDLLTPMMNGDKQTGEGVPSARDDWGTRLLALLLFLLCGGAVTALLTWAA
jgi:cytochrome b